MPKTKSTKGLHDWGDGKGKVHTIPKNVHTQNVQAKGYGIDLNAPAAAPMSNRQVYGQAQQAADLEYNPQIQAVQGMQAAIPEWYGNFLERSATAAAEQQQRSQALLAPAQQWAGQAPAAAPGLDPNSQAAQASTQAATSGQGLAQLGYSTLAAIPAASGAYTAGLQQVAAKDQLGAQALYGQQAAQLQGQRGAAVAKNYGDYRGQEQNASIAYSTLGLNQSKAAADVDLARGKDPVTGEDLPQETPTGYGPGSADLNKYGYTADEWGSLSPKEQARERKGNDKTAQKAAEKAAKEKQKKRSAIDTATGKLRNQVTDVSDYQQNLVGQEGEDRSKKPDVNGNYPTRKITQKDIDNAKVAKYGTLGRIAIAVRDGKPLTAEQQAYLHQKDPNFRIPREWIRGKTPPNRPTANLGDDGSGQQRPT